MRRRELRQWCGGEVMRRRGIRERLQDEDEKGHGKRRFAIAGVKGNDIERDIGT